MFRCRDLPRCTGQRDNRNKRDFCWTTNEPNLHQCQILTPVKIQNTIGLEVVIHSRVETLTLCSITQLHKCVQGEGWVGGGGCFKGCSCELYCRSQSAIGLSLQPGMRNVFQPRLWALSLGPAARRLPHPPPVNDLSEAHGSAKLLRVDINNNSMKVERDGEENGGKKKPRQS